MAISSARRAALAAELAQLIWDPRAVRQVAAAAGISLRTVRRGASPGELWLDIVAAAADQDRLPQLLDSVALEQGDLPEPTDPAEPQRDDSPVDPSWETLAEEDVEEFERQLAGRSTLLPVSFLQAGLASARSVCKISYAAMGPDGRPRTVTGTGFLIGPDELLTCHHVLPTTDIAARCLVEFNYEQDLSGVELAPEPVALAPDRGFATSGSTDFDWTIVRTEGAVGDQYGFLKLEPVDLADISYVNIIGHPHGESKQLSLYYNVLHKFDDNRVLYTTETSRGSSGSPVFDSEWRVVGLHNGWRKTFDRGRLRRVVRNAAININRVIARDR